MARKKTSASKPPPVPRTLIEVLLRTGTGDVMQGQIVCETPPEDVLLAILELAVARGWQPRKSWSESL